MVELTIEHGLSALSSVGFVMYGVMLCRYVTLYSCVLDWLRLRTLISGLAMTRCWKGIAMADLLFALAMLSRRQFGYVEPWLATTVASILEGMQLTALSSH